MRRDGEVESSEEGKGKWAGKKKKEKKSGVKREMEPERKIWDEGHGQRGREDGGERKQVIEPKERSGEGRRRD